MNWNLPESRLAVLLLIRLKMYPYTLSILDYFCGFSNSLFPAWLEMEAGKTGSREQEMGKRKQVNIGIIGAGFLAETRGRCYSKAGGIDARIAAVADTDPERAAAFCRRFEVSDAYPDFRDILKRTDIDMVDLCVPNHLHRPMAVAAAQAGKHVVCTKPLTAYVGQDLPEGVRDSLVSDQPRRKMLAMAAEDAEAMVDAAEKAGVRLMYGENWIFAPAMSRTVSLLAASRASILEMRGGEIHSGSHSPFSKVWRYTGGGSLVRLGAHPIGAMIYLKQEEGMARNGKPIRPVSVFAEIGDLSRVTPAGDKTWIAGGWQDVENWATVIITFEDGSRGTAWASDAALGGMESRLEVLASNCHFKLNLSSNNLVQAFSLSPEVFSGAYIMEKIETSAGWNTPMPDEDWTSGHLAMCQAFARSVAEGSDVPSDGRLGMEVVRVIYSAYCSAGEGARVML